MRTIRVSMRRLGSVDRDRPASMAKAVSSRYRRLRLLAVERLTGLLLGPLT